MNTITDEERQEESNRARERNLNSLHIQVIDNGIVVKEGDRIKSTYFPNLLEAMPTIREFIERRKKENYVSENMRIANASKKLRMGSRRRERGESRDGVMLGEFE